ncbi:unnamed protein product [Paramecium pentaurelia]|uniref:Uncharacterized protein n=1 Tax=Paramecium pentaurelia TaxID=43138 RepID=A0A8S1YPW3_9CILI|nr:unnamed protein product [Paramecium pentaurelia]
MKIIHKKTTMFTQHLLGDIEFQIIKVKKAVMKFMKNEILFQINYTGVNFTFGEYSIIHCQYDPKNNTLNLLHQNDGITYQMDIANNNLEMSPCVMLYGTAEIEQI